MHSDGAVADTAHDLRGRSPVPFRGMSHGAQALAPRPTPESVATASNAPAKGAFRWPAVVEHPEPTQSREASVRPRWVLRVFGRRHDVVRLRDDRLDIRIGSRTDSLLLAELTIGTSSGLLGTDVRIASRSAEHVLRCVAGDRAVAFEGVVRLRQARARLVQLLDALSALLTGPAYLNRAQVVAWSEEATAVVRPLLGLIAVTPHTAPSDDTRLLDSVRAALRDLDARVEARNRSFVAHESERCAALFETIEPHPLSPRQVEAILHDEDHALVVAGAGTGKTSTIVGKVAYLLKCGLVQRREILALAYNRKAATELAERIEARIGETVTVDTFHALGYRVISKVRGERPAITGLASDPAGLTRWIGDTFGRILASPELRQRYLEFVVYERDVEKSPGEFRSAAAYTEYIRENKPRTLTGVTVKSFEERLLADWLTIHGVAYEYEKPYEHDTATATHRQYRPDFFLTDYGIYLEHFGVDRSGATAPYVDRATYHAGIEWKRALHAQYGTRLLETYSYERMEGTYRQVWAERFEAAGIRLQPISGDELNTLLAKARPSQAAELMGRFLTVARENMQDMSVLRRVAAGRMDASRCLAFLALYEEVHTRYRAYLSERREIDFADMVIQAAEYIEDGRHVPGFRRIIVDEFQDISRGRLRLLQAVLRAPPGARLLCVGDDWQSIYGYAGSDVGIIRHFAEIFGVTKRTDLDRTFRFNDRLLDASSRFVQRNPRLLTKSMRAGTVRQTPAITLLYRGERALQDALEAIYRDEAFDGTASVLVLGRYTATAPSDLTRVAQRHPSLRISFLTVHKSKGLEADYVIVLDVADRAVGFPSQLSNDPVLSLVLTDDDPLPHAEERRVFYVALTRARHRVYVCVPPSAPSVFAKELAHPDFAGMVSVDQKARPRLGGLGTA